MNASLARILIIGDDRKLVGKLTEEQTLRLSYEQRTDEGERSQRPQWIPSSFNRLLPLRSERETWTVNYGWQPVDSDLVDLELTTFHTENELHGGHLRPSVITLKPASVQHSMTLC